MKKFQKYFILILLILAILVIGIPVPFGNNLIIMLVFRIIYISAIVFAFIKVLRSK